MEFVYDTIVIYLTEVTAVQLWKTAPVLCKIFQENKNKWKAGTHV